MAFKPQTIIDELIKRTAGRAVCVAYSGGVDSHVLLHLLASHRHPQLPGLRAIHIDHGLHADSAQWSEHCRQVADRLNVDFKSIAVRVDNIDTLGLEAAARQARYDAFRSHLDPETVLLTAQHQDDQAETLLLQLLRGAGPTGLSAMWPETELSGLTVLRPLLDVPRSELLAYAEQYQLQWLDDPSNADIRINRNYLRQEIWPRLSQRWPALSRTLSRSAAHCRESVALMADLASLDARQVCPEQRDSLCLAALKQLSPARQRNLLRYLLQKKGLPLPSTAILQRILEEVIPAAADRMPEVRWPGVIVRRYRNALYLEADADNATACESVSLEIRGPTDISLPDGRCLKWRQESGQGLKQEVLNRPLRLGFREGGERIRLQGHAQHKTLKQLFQEWQVPPWQRSQVPLLFLDEELIAVVGYGYAARYAADTSEQGWIPVLEQAGQTSF